METLCLSCLNYLVNCASIYVRGTFLVELMVEEDKEINL